MENSIEGKCIACYDTKIINKGTEVEEECPICKNKDGKAN
jgi:hypothetical protein